MFEELSAIRDEHKRKMDLTSDCIRSLRLHGLEGHEGCQFNMELTVCFKNSYDTEAIVNVLDGLLHFHKGMK